MTWHIVGIDLSLTNAGIARIRGDAERPVLRNVLSSPERSGRLPDGKPYATLLDRRQRIQRIAARVLDAALTDWDPDADDAPLFVIEGPLYGGTTSASASAHDRSGLWWYVTTLLFKRGAVVEVPPTVLKKYATGSGSAKKAGVLASIPRLAPGVFVDDDNAADALVLALMGARALGHPREPSPQRVTASALNAVRWPAIPTRTGTPTS